MPEKVRGRYTPMYDELAGTIKVFLIAWIISTVVLYCALGFSKWAFWGAIGLGFICSIIITYLLAIITGSTTIQIPFSNNNKNNSD